METLRAIKNLKLSIYRFSADENCGGVQGDSRTRNEHRKLNKEENHKLEIKPVALCPHWEKNPEKMKFTEESLSKEDKLQPSRKLSTSRGLSSPWKPFLACEVTWHLNYLNKTRQLKPLIYAPWGELCVAWKPTSPPKLRSVSPRILIEKLKNFCRNNPLPIARRTLTIIMN